MQVKGSDFVMYHVSNLENSLKFYRDILGMTVEGQYGGDWVELTATPTTLALYRPEEGEPRVGGASIGLAVDDVAAAVDELKEKDVEVVWGAGESPVCHFAVIKDPDGNNVILHQRKDGTFG